MPAKNVLKNWQLFVDGRGYAGLCTNYQPPALALVLSEMRAGGMDFPESIDMGMEALEFTFEMGGQYADLISRFGLAPGQEIPVTLRGALQDHDGVVKAAVHKFRTGFTRVERGPWVGGENSSSTFTARPSFFSEMIGGKPVVEIDRDRLIRKMGGVDQLEAIREAIGM